MKAVNLLSGGLDSTVLAFKLKAEGYDLFSLGFNYGQRHVRELNAARYIAKLVGAEFHQVSIHVAAGEGLFFPLAEILGGSALTDDKVVVPDGHYAQDNMKATIVPNRNAIMLSIAYGVAVSQHAELVAFAAHSGDHAIYPDCRPEFVESLERTLNLGSDWNDPIRVSGPFLDNSKAEIVQIGHDLGVPFEETWSCYKGGDLHCGTCGTCYERREAFKLAGVKDPTRYVDSTTTFAEPPTHAARHGSGLQAEDGGDPPARTHSGLKKPAEGATPKGK